MAESSGADKPVLSHIIFICKSEVMTMVIAREILENPDDDGKATHLLENIDVTGQQENLDDQNSMDPIDDSILPEEEPESRNRKSNGCLFKPVVVDEDEYMLERVRNLSFEQRIVFDKFVQFTKTILRNMKGASTAPIPPNIIVTGNFTAKTIIFHSCHIYLSFSYTYYRRRRSWKNISNHNISKMDN